MRVGQVGDEGARGRAELVDDALDRLGAHVLREHLRPGPGERPRGGGADGAARAGDQHDAAMEIDHRAPLRSRGVQCAGTGGPASGRRPHREPTRDQARTIPATPAAAMVPSAVASATAGSPTSIGFRSGSELHSSQPPSYTAIRSQPWRSA